MRFVAIKTVVQQELLTLHRIRQRLVIERTAKANQLRGLRAEFGIVLPQAFVLWSAAFQRSLPMPRTDYQTDCGSALASSSANCVSLASR
jgi:transposase